MVKELQSTGETKAKIEFATEVSKDYKLDIKSIEVKKELADKNVKFVADINVLDGNNNVVKISNIKMKIRIALPENLKRYDKYEIVYISNGEIKETIPAAVENGYIVFETSVYKGYKQDKIEMRGDRAEMSDFPLYLNTVAGGLDCRDQTIGGFSFVVKIYALPVVEIIG